MRKAGEASKETENSYLTTKGLKIITETMEFTTEGAATDGQEEAEAPATENSESITVIKTDLITEGISKESKDPDTERVTTVRMDIRQM